MSRRRFAQVYSSTANVAALNQVQSGWLDIGKKAMRVEVYKTHTGGTYVFEVDWSRDGGSTTLVTDTITTTNANWTPIPAKARWMRVRVKNTHAANPFTAHDTKVYNDLAVGR